ncbi:hypothetical protein ACIRQQ_01965 [Streptomyces fuscichromogenes]|uniref:hypothetical protein n=1 Tax=Streptomyces fuscichromogenes TaxID=1324013 RepID=UPI0038265A63
MRFAVALGRGATGLVEGGYEWRTDDWRPSPGFSVGAAVGSGITLAAGTSRGECRWFW